MIDKIKEKFCCPVLSKSKRYLKAFTLIELLITCTIILVMSAIAIPSYNKYSGKQEFLQKSDEIKAMVDQARTFAQSPDQNNDRYEVVIDTGAKTATLRYKKLVSGDYTEIKVVTLSSDVTWSLIPAGKTVYACDTPAEKCCLYDSGQKTAKCLNPDSADTANGNWLKLTYKSGTASELIRTISFKNNLAVISP